MVLTHSWRSLQAAKMTFEMTQNCDASQKPLAVISKYKEAKS